MYSEFSDDPKVQMLPEAMQRRLVMLFCERCKGETLHETERAFHWRVTETELAETKALFMQKEFIDESWNLLNWNKRQFLSDSSTDRVRRHRSHLKQDETLQKQDEPKKKRPVPVTVTAPDTEADTEQKQQAAKPPAVSFSLPLWVHTDTWQDFEAHRGKLRKPMTDRARRDIIAKLDGLRAKGQDPEAMLAQSIRKGWQDVFEVRDDLFVAPKANPLAAVRFANGGPR
jgi:hypothetical protein